MASPEVRIIEEPPGSLAGYPHGVSIAFEVRARLRVEAIRNGLGGLAFSEEPLAQPYVHDGDSFETPSSWTERWDLSRWGVFAAYDGDLRIGSAVIAFGSPDVFFLEGRMDIAALWDLRVRPEYRRGGIGARLFSAAAEWSRGRGCEFLKIETQNINLPACRFYAAQGCHLGGVNIHAYPDSPDDMQLTWYLTLS